ncbi:ABC transporter family protein, partial [Vibrio parahaemolyticus V-223/04]
FPVVRNVVLVLRERYFEMLRFCFLMSQPKASTSVPNKKSWRFSTSILPTRRLCSSLTDSSN